MYIVATKWLTIIVWLFLLEFLNLYRAIQVNECVPRSATNVGMCSTNDHFSACGTANMHHIAMWCICKTRTLYI